MKWEFPKGLYNDYGSRSAPSCGELLFLPANTSSHTQFLDAGVIQNLSSIMNHPCKFLDNQMEEENQSAGTTVKQVTITDAAEWIKAAWQFVCPYKKETVGTKLGIYE